MALRFDMATNPPNLPTDDDAVPPSAANADDRIAADLIRQKVARLYETEPAASAEIAEAGAASHRSKHQQFMYELSTSGKDLAAVQTEWHNYYQDLPAHEKHQVWQEFYSSQPAAAGLTPAAPNVPQALAKHKRQAARGSQAGKLRDARTKDQIQAAIRDKVTAGGKLTAKHHLQSLFFGLGVGAIVLVIFLFGFFNEVLIAPFIQPSRASADTPLIVNSNSVAPSSTPEVIIPKINVEIPVNYDQRTTDEGVIENALESGVVHYPTTTHPGENGNAAYFGHSSNNIFNKGKYKFAFVLLHTLETGDTFYLTYNGKVYVYKVITKKVVEPSEVSVLSPVPGQAATATLITCDPPGTSLHRLVIVGQQISPDPTGNTQATTPTSVDDTSAAESLPGNGPTLLGRLLRATLGKLVIGALVAIVIVIAVRWLNRRIAASVT
jgi:sortase A